MKFEIVMGVLIAVHLIMAWQTQKMINETSIFNDFQKRFNSRLNWIIPFFWSMIIRYIIKESSLGVMTKAQRNKVKKRKSGSDGWQHLTGTGG